MTGILRGGEKVVLIRLYLQEAVQRAFLVAIIYVVFKGIYLAVTKKKVHIGKEILYCVTLTYMVTLLGYIMLPNIHIGIESNGKFYFICDMWGNGRINFIPFKTIGTFLFQSKNVNVSQWKAVSSLNLLANIGLFVPYGVIAWFYPWYQKSLKRITGSGALLSVIIEVEQIFIQRGTDIDDVILNTLGVLIGGIIAMLGSKYVWPSLKQLKNGAPKWK